MAVVEDEVRHHAPGRHHTLSRDRRLPPYTLRQDSPISSEEIRTRPRTLPIFGGSLRWALVAIMCGIGGAVGGYLGATEVHRLQNPPVATNPSEGLDLDTRKALIDGGDRYRLTNERVNEQWKVIVYLERNNKLQDAKIAELQAYTGIDRPKATPRPRPTVSQRLRGATPTS